MNRASAILGLICGATVLMGFFSPWLELNSRSYELGGARVKDHLTVSGWNLAQGKLDVLQTAESLEHMRWEKYKTIEIQVERKFYPYLDLAGGILIVFGGIFLLMSKRRIPHLIVILGGVLAFVGGCLGFLDNRWIRYSTIIITENYAVFGYYGQGLLLCVIGSFILMAGWVIVWSAKQ